MPATVRPFSPLVLFAALIVGFVSPIWNSPLSAQCPIEPTLQNYTGGGAVVCPCFVPTEEAGVVLDAPAAHYPIEIMKVGIGWASNFGGSPQSLEQGIHVYGAGLPNPGAPVATLPGPLLSDGAINEFNLEAQLGSAPQIASGPFSVTLEFLNQNSGNPFAPSVIHDGNGCQPGKNLVYAVPGGWLDACPLGVTGDWVFYVIYRQKNCTPLDAGDPFVISNRPVHLMAPFPNPVQSSTRMEFVLAQGGESSLRVFDTSGRVVDSVHEGYLGAGAHTFNWSARTAGLPSGMYFLELRSDAHRAVQKLIVVD